MSMVKMRISFCIRRNDDTHCSLILIFACITAIVADLFWSFIIFGLTINFEYSIKDQHDVFQLYQKTERERLSLQEDAKTLRELREQAPDKLREVLATAEQRKSAKHSSSFKSFGNGWSK